jgi:hypothetical protein
MLAIVLRQRGELGVVHNPESVLRYVVVEKTLKI